MSPALIPLRIVLACLALVAWLALPSALAQVPPDLVPANLEKPAGRWTGALEVPGQQLVMSFVLKREDEGWSGTLDVPSQGLRNFALSDVVVDGQSIRFALAGIPGEPTFEGTINGDTLTGELNQGGAVVPFTFKYGVPLEEPRRPQEPKPPFPYEAREVTFDSLSEGVTLAGTLTLPEGEGPFPAVVLVSGSGSQNRDEEVFGHKPFLVLADALTRSGIAVLRYDDRGVGKSTGDPTLATTGDLSQDAEAAVRFLREQDNIQHDRVGIAGHSEGGLIAPMVAARSKEVAFIVLMAGPGVSGDQVLVRQVREGAIAEGMAMDTAATIGEAVAEMVDQIKAPEVDEEVIKRALERVLRLQMNLPAQSAVPAAAVEGMYASYASPWFRYFLTYDPAEALSKVNVPVLVLQGSLDRQVNAEVNVAAIEKALEHNDRVQVEVLEGLNHLFQPARTGGGSEYAQIETTMDPRVPEIIAEWIKAMAASTRPATRPS